MKTFVLTDLDDTLFSSARTHGARAELSVASYTEAGEPVCYYSPEQRALVSHLKRLGTLIPVTGRSSESLARVTGLELSSYRVVSHGALVLDPHGEPLGAWLSEQESALGPWRARLKEAEAFTAQWAARRGAQLRLRLVYDHGLPTYLSVKGEALTLAQLAEELRPSWAEGLIHHNRRNLACLPPYASKANAVTFLIEHLKALHDEPLLFIGLGDSVSDVPFLKLCDLAITPKQSHIHRELWP